MFQVERIRALAEFDAEVGTPQIGDIVQTQLQIEPHNLAHFAITVETKKQFALLKEPHLYFFLGRIDQISGGKVGGIARNELLVDCGIPLRLVVFNILPDDRIRVGNMLTGDGYLVCFLDTDFGLLSNPASIRVVDIDVVSSPPFVPFRENPNTRIQQTHTFLSFTTARDAGPLRTLHFSTLK